jgi:hypothetical protein
VPDDSIVRLRAVGVLTYVESAGWYRFRSRDGYSFEMQGIPAAEREDYSFGRHEVRATFYDLNAEACSRGFLLRVFDVGSLNDDDKEHVRAEAEEQITRTGVVHQPPRSLVAHGARVREVFVEEVTRNGHYAIVRTYVQNGRVVQATLVSDPGEGDISDFQHFFASIAIDG